MFLILCLPLPVCFLKLSLLLVMLLLQVMGVTPIPLPQLRHQPSTLQQQQQPRNDGAADDDDGDGGVDGDDHQPGPTQDTQQYNTDTLDLTGQCTGGSAGLPLGEHKGNNGTAGTSGAAAEGGKPVAAIFSKPSALGGKSSGGKVSGAGSGEGVKRKPDVGGFNRLASSGRAEGGSGNPFARRKAK